jgi:hypothetical protein
MATWWKVAGLALALSVATPGYAHEHDSPADLALEKMQQIIGALRQMIDDLPLYEAPEILDNGDIIIRRKRPEEEQAKPPDDEDNARI